MGTSTKSLRFVAFAFALTVGSFQPSLARADGGATGEGASAPITAITLDYGAAVVSNLSGGIRQSSTYIGNLHLRGLFDLDRAWGWRDTRFFVDGLWIHGGNPDAAPGDALGVNNLSAPSRAQVEELWLERNFDGDRVSLLGGLYDVNTEMYRLQSSGLFLNSAFGMGAEFSQSGLEGPSTFPRTALGVRFAYKPSANTVLRAGVFDGVPVIRPDGSVGAFESGDGLLYIAEIAVLDRPGQKIAGDRRMRIGRNAMLPPYQGKLAIGAWHYTTRLERIDAAESQTERGASGFYAIADRVVAHATGNPDRSVSVFAQVGVGDPTVGRFARSASLGVVSTGPFGVRPDDELGVAFVTARNGDAYFHASGGRTQGGAENLTHTEGVIELTYLAHITPRLAVQPDLQYIMHPDTRRSVPDALVFSLRMEYSVGW